MRSIQFASLAMLTCFSSHATAQEGSSAPEPPVVTQETPKDSPPAPSVEPGGVEPGGVEPGGVEPGGVEPAPAVSTPPVQEFPLEEAPAEEQTPPPVDQPIPPPLATRAEEPAITEAPSTSDNTSSKPETDGGKEDDGPTMGVYIAMNGGLMFGMKSTHEWNETCPSSEVEGAPQLDWNPSCRATAPIGGMIEARLGFRYTYVGIEIFALGAGDYTSGKLDGELPAGIELPSYASDMQIGRVGGGFGGGLRFLTPPKWVRASAGLGGGVIFRHVFTNMSSLDGSSVGYNAPIFRADAGMVLFGFINIGVMGWLEFSKDVSITPDFSDVSAFAGSDSNAGSIDMLDDAFGAITVFEGTQYFFGPYLGMSFGK